MNFMDCHLTKHPSEGVKSMIFLLMIIGFIDDSKRLRRLFRIMVGIQFLNAENQKIWDKGVF